MSGDLAAFLAARYDEAEALARDSGGYLDSGTPEELAVDLSHFTWRGKSIAPSSIAYIAMHRPQNRLADIKLKRAILAEHPHQRIDHNWTGRHDLDGPFGCATCHIGISGDVYEGGWCATVRQLGTEFDQHAAYRTEWRPE